MPYADPQQKAEYQREWARAFRRAQPHRHAASVKRWMAAHPEHAAEISSRKKTPEQRIVINARWRERMKTDPTFRIRMRISKQMNKALAARGASKRGQAWQALVGYGPAELRSHLETQFEWWMSWENYGLLWEIDHIKPVSLFTLPDEISMCWALSNLRPLQKEINRARRL